MLAILGRVILGDRTISAVLIEVSGDGDPKAAKRLIGKRIKALTRTLQAMGISKKKLKLKSGPVPGDNEIGEITLVRGRRRERFDPLAWQPGLSPSASGEPAKPAPTTDSEARDGKRHHRRHHRSKKK